MTQAFIGLSEIVDKSYAKSIKNRRTKLCYVSGVPELTGLLIVAILAVME